MYSLVWMTSSTTWSSREKSTSRMFCENARCTKLLIKITMKFKWHMRWDMFMIHSRHIHYYLKYWITSGTLGRVCFYADWDIYQNIQIWRQIYQNEWIRRSLENTHGVGFSENEEKSDVKKIGGNIRTKQSNLSEKKSSNDYFIVRWHARGAWGGPTAWGIGLKNGHRLVWGRVRSAGEWATKKTPIQMYVNSWWAGIVVSVSKNYV